METMESCDVFVVGGGPGGSTVSTFLAMEGWDVVMVEKMHHPRFHIGESMLPKFLPIVEKLGLLEEVDKLGILKLGADFNSAAGTPERHDFFFRNAMDKWLPHAYEVRRSAFDQLLFENSKRKGARGFEGIKVTQVEFSSGAGSKAYVYTVSKEHGKQVWKCRYFVDATGRDAFLANKYKFKRKNPKHQSAAIFGHFENVVRRSGENAGNISAYWFEHGWMWMIPLKDGPMSMGAVCNPEYLKSRNVSPEEFLFQTLELAPPEMRSRIKDARLINEVRATGNYSYQCTQMYGDGWLMVGDAYAFIDPIFSSGVLMAMTNGMHASEIISAILRGQPGTDAMLRRYQKTVQKGITTFSWFIERFNTPAMQRLFLQPGNPLRIEEAVTSVLAGDVYGNPKVEWRLQLFKLLYYIYNVLDYRNAWRAFRRRVRTRSINFTGGTTEQDVA